MPDGFYEKSLASVTVYFESQETIVTALKEDFTTLEAINLGKNSTLKDYGQAVLANNQKSEELKEKDGLTIIIPLKFTLNKKNQNMVKFI